MSSVYAGLRGVADMRLGDRRVSLWRGGVRVFPQFDPEAELVLTGAQGAGPYWLDIQRWDDVVFAAEARFPVAGGEGVLFENGGGGSGVFFGLREGGAVFRARAGHGGSEPPDPAQGAVFVDIHDPPADDRVHVVVVEIVVGPPPAMRVWIDGVLKGAASAPAPLNQNVWAGSASGGVLTGENANVVGEPGGPWPGGLEGQLRAYAGQRVEG